MLELTFVMAQRQNLFFVEMVEALRHELSQLGVSSTVTTADFPPPAPERVYVIVPPHEFVALGGRLPGKSLRDRTIFVCGEQPGSSHFQENIELAPLAGAVFDFSRWSIREFARQGISAEHFQVGYSALWDHFDPTRERDIDVLFMGCYSDRRGEYLAGFADSLWRWRSHMILSDNSAPNWLPSARFLVGREQVGSFSAAPAFSSTCTRAPRRISNGIASCRPSATAASS